MGYIKLNRNQANEGDFLLLPSENIHTVKSGGATDLVIKYGIVSNPAASATAEIMTHTFVIAAKTGFTLTQDSIVESVLEAIESAGESGPNQAPASFEVTSQTISGETF